MEDKRRTLGHALRDPAELCPPESCLPRSIRWSDGAAGKNITSSPSSKLTYWMVIDFYRKGRGVHITLDFSTQIQMCAGVRLLPLFQWVSRHAHTQTSLPSRNAVICVHCWAADFSLNTFLFLGPCAHWRYLGRVFLDSLLRMT